MFSSIGGICSAFKQAGFDISWANEIDDKACKTYKLNFPNTNLIEQDVHKIQPDDNLKVDIITSGFPCQAFSVAGYRKKDLMMIEVIYFLKLLDLLIN